METIHFTKLAHRAERGRIERGVRYVHCHTGSAGMCYEELALTPIVMRPRDHGVPERNRSGDPWWSKKAAVFQTLRQSPWMPEGWYRIWHYAGDAGLWDVPGEYRNDWNYMLNVNALLREGIIIDTTKVQR